MDYQMLGILYDILFLAVLLLTAWTQRNRGLLAGMLDLGGTIAGIVGGVWATRAWAQTLYTEHLGVSIGEKLAETMAEYGNDLGPVLDRFPFLPQALRDKLAELLTLQDPADALVPRLVAALEPVILPLLQALLFLLVCLAVRVTVRVLSRLLRHFNDLPVLGEFNRIFGFAFGFVTGLLDCWLLVLALWLLARFTAGRYGFLTETVLEHSIAYRFFGNFNPFTV